MDIDNEFERLTKQQKYILTTLYKQYVACLKEGHSNNTCNHFQDVNKVHSNYLQQFHFEDVNHDLKRLKALDFINGAFGDNTIIEIMLTDNTVVYFENRFKHNMKKIVKYLSYIASFIPGL